MKTATIAPSIPILATPGVLFALCTGLLLMLPAALPGPAQAQHAPDVFTSTRGNDLFGDARGGYKTLDFVCDCTPGNNFTNVTLRYEEAGGGRIRIGGAGPSQIVAFGEMITINAPGPSVRLQVDKENNGTFEEDFDVITNCDTSALLYRLFPDNANPIVRIIAYEAPGTPTSCTVQADLQCTFFDSTPSAPTSGQPTTFNATFRNSASGGSPTFPGFATNLEMTVHFNRGSWRVTNAGGGIVDTSTVAGTITFPVSTLGVNGARDFNFQLTVKNPPNPTVDNVTIAVTDVDLSDPTPNPTCQLSFSNLPVELVSFDAVVDGRSTTLRWQTASETNNAGFEIHSRFGGPHLEKGEDGWNVLGFVGGHGTTELPRSYSYNVDGLQPGRHIFRLKQVDYDGSFEYSPEIEVAVAMPDAFAVSEVYPNPFNPQASFSFGVRNAQRVTVDVYNLLGQRVLELYRGHPEAGVTQTLFIDGSGLQSGTYVVRVLGESFVDTQTITLVK